MCNSKTDNPALFTIQTYAIISISVAQVCVLGIHHISDAHGSLKANVGREWDDVV